MLQSLRGKVEIGSLRLSQKTNFFQETLLFTTLFVIPFQFGKHFWPTFSYVAGQRVDYLSPTVYVSDIFILLLAATTSVSFLRKQKSRFRIKSGTTILKFSCILLFLSIGIFLSPSPLVGWYVLLKLVELTFFGWYISKQKTITGKLFWVFFFGIFIEGFLASLQFFHQGSLGGLWYFLGERSFSASTPGIANASIRGQLVLRPYATFSHPNVLAGYLVISLLFFLTWILTYKNYIQKILSIVVLVFGTFILLLTLSRVAISVFIVLGLVALIMRFTKQKFLIVLASCFLLVGILFSSSLLFGRFFDLQGYIESLGLRDVLIQSAWRIFLSHPILGVGLGNFLVILPRYMHAKLLFGFLQPVHNIFLLVLAETGIIGLGIFLFIVWKAFYNSWQKKKDGLFQFSFLALLAICCIGMTDHYFLTLQQGQLLLALILGISFTNHKSQATTPK